MDEINIVIPDVSTISISGTDKQKLNFKHVEAKSEASRCGGKVIRDVELANGFFMEVMFENHGMKEFWESKIGVTKK